jgi:hypothetical protein
MILKKMKTKQKNHWYITTLAQKVGRLAKALILKGLQKIWLCENSKCRAGYNMPPFVQFAKVKRICEVRCLLRFAFA